MMALEASEGVAVVAQVTPTLLKVKTLARSTTHLKNSLYTEVTQRIARAANVESCVHLKDSRAQ